MAILRLRGCQFPVPVIFCVPLLCVCGFCYLDDRVLSPIPVMFPNKWSQLLWWTSSLPLKPKLSGAPVQSFWFTPVDNTSTCWISVAFMLWWPILQSTCSHVFLRLARECSPDIAVYAYMKDKPKCCLEDTRNPHTKQPIKPSTHEHKAMETCTQANGRVCGQHTLKQRVKQRVKQAIKETTIKQTTRSL